jgi:hypothetical protein
MFGPDAVSRQPESIVRKAKTMRCEHVSLMTKGKLQNCKCAQVQSGDVIFFKFNLGKGK